MFGFVVYLLTNFFGWDHACMARLSEMSETACFFFVGVTKFQFCTCQFSGTCQVSQILFNHCRLKTTAMFFFVVYSTWSSFDGTPRTHTHTFTAIDDKNINAENVKGHWQYEHPEVNTFECVCDETNDYEAGFAQFALFILRPTARRLNHTYRHSIDVCNVYLVMQNNTHIDGVDNASHTCMQWTNDSTFK